MFDIEKHFEQVYVGACAAGDADDMELADKAETFIYTCLLNHHELPYVNPIQCPFTANQLAKQMGDAEIKSLWDETLEKFPPRN